MFQHCIDEYKGVYAEVMTLAFNILWKNSYNWFMISDDLN